VRRAEGWVLKDGNMLNWRKLKVERTIDAFVIATNDGKGKHLGQVGSLELAVYRDDDTWVPICSCGGMTDDERSDMSLKSPIGRVVEVTYQLVDAKGRLRHPRFVRFRDDKRSVECLADQDVELAELLR